MFKLYKDSINNLNSTSRFQRLFNRSFSYFRYLKSFVLDSQKNDSISKRDVVFLSDGVSFAQVMDVWYEKFCDPIIAYCKKNELSTLLLNPLDNYYVPRYSTSIFIQPFLDFSILKQFIHGKKKFNEQLEGFDAFEDRLKTSHFSFTISKERLRFMMCVIQAYSNYFETILKKVQPKIGFCVSYYGYEGFSFNLACRRLGIPSVDIQHGVAGEYHAAYGKWLKVPKTGYELLPRFFWCWEEEDAKSIKKWNCNIQKWHSPFIGGNLFLNMWKDNKSNMVRQHDALLWKFIHKKNILITLSSTQKENDHLFHMILPIMKSAGSSYMWWIRIHPCALQTEQSIINSFRKYSFYKKQIIISEASSLPLYALLRHMSIHITYNSSTVIEAERFHIFSILLGTDAKQFYANQINHGLAKYASRTKDIKKLIEQKSLITKSF